MSLFRFAEKSVRNPKQFSDSMAYCDRSNQNGLLLNGSTVVYSTQWKWFTAYIEATILFWNYSQLGLC